MEIEKKVVLLTGARRIGQVVAVELAKKKANLAIVYRSSAEEAEAMCNDCKKLGVKAFPFQADLSKEDEAEKMVADVYVKFGRIDGLVHMAANYPRTPWKEITVQDFDSEIQIIPRSAFLLGKLVGARMKEGKIIFFSDWAANRAPYKDYAAYLAAKGTVETLTRVLAVELAPTAVNAIAPGPILRPPDLTEEEDAEVAKRTLLKPWPGPIEIAKAVIFLLESDFITGAVLPVDGGRSIA